MKNQILAALAFALITPPAFGVGGQDGNGGDAVICRPSSENSFSGLYTLDYLTTYNAFNKNSDIAPIASWQASVERMSRFLSAFAPEYKPSFDEFVAQIDNHSDYSASRIWLSGPAALVDIKDEKLLRLVPKNCGGTNGEPQFIQTVIRLEETSPSGYIKYLADAQIIGRLKAIPLQYSFLMVHEWLRDLYKDSEEIRDINRYIHSTTWETDSFTKVQSTLRRLKFRTQYASESSQTKRFMDAFQSVKDGRSEGVRQALQDGFGDWRLSSGLSRLCETNPSLCELPSLQAYPSFKASDFTSSVSLLEYAILTGNQEIIDELLRRATPKSHVHAIDFALILKKEDLARRLVEMGFPTFAQPYVIDAAVNSDDIAWVERLRTKWNMSIAGPELLVLAARHKALNVAQYAVSLSPDSQMPLTFVRSTNGPSSYAWVGLQGYPLSAWKERLTYGLCLGDCHLHLDIPNPNVVAYLILSGDVEALRFLKVNKLAPNAFRAQMPVEFIRQEWVRGWEYRNTPSQATPKEILQKAVESAEHRRAKLGEQWKQMLSLL